MMKVEGQRHKYNTGTLAGCILSRVVRFSGYSPALAAEPYSYLLGEHEAERKNQNAWRKSGTYTMSCLCLSRLFFLAVRSQSGCFNGCRTSKV